MGESPEDEEEGGAEAAPEPYEEEEEIWVSFPRLVQTCSDLSKLVQTCPDYSNKILNMNYLPFFRFLCDIHISISHIHTFLLCNNYQFCLISYTPVLKSRVLHYLDIGQNIFTFKTAHL